MTEDEWDAMSADAESAYVADCEAAVAELAMEMANMLSQIHRHLLKYDMHETMYGQPNGKTLFDGLDSLVDRLDIIQR